MSVVSLALGQDMPKYQVNLGETCELTNKYLGELATEAVKNNERIFVISRLGKTEPSKLNDLRLDLAQKSLFIKDVPKNMTVLAIGKRTSKNYGMFEFYLGSKFFLTVQAKRGYPGCLL